MVNVKDALGEWFPIMKDLFKKPYFEEIGNTIVSATNQGFVVYPAAQDIFRAFKLCPPNKVRVIILGQDPYHNGSAVGLAFANREGDKMSPSLRVINKELTHSYSTEFSLNPNLEYWADQGVLLLNTALTVVEGKAGSHLAIWEPFIKDVLEILTEKYTGLIYVLWGKKAQAWKTPDMELSNYVLEAPHPAAELYGGKESFIGSGNFLAIDGILMMNSNEVIHWDYNNYVKYISSKPADSSHPLSNAIGHRPTWD